MGHIQAQSREVMTPFAVKNSDLIRRWGGEEMEKKKKEHFVDHILKQKNLTKSIESNSILKVNFK